jgi:hypothetical protein
METMRVKKILFVKRPANVMPPSFWICASTLLTVMKMEAKRRYL